MVLDGAVLETPLMGEGVDQKAGWKELLSEAAGAAAGELLAATGKKCQVARFEEIAAEAKITQAFQLRSGGRAWTVSGAGRGAGGGSAEASEKGAAAAEPARPTSPPAAAATSGVLFGFTARGV